MPTRSTTAARPLGRRRCRWAREPLDIVYHDDEWGVPVRDDRLLFEFLLLEGAQAGLSWSTILRSAPAIDAPSQASIRGGSRASARRRAAAARRRGHRAQPRQDRGRRRTTRRRSWRCRPSTARSRSTSGVSSRDVRGRIAGARSRRGSGGDRVSRALSADLRRRGFRFVGPTICYAFMQAVGLVNDHALDCFRYRAVARLAGGRARSSSKAAAISRPRSAITRRPVSARAAAGQPK